MIGKTAGILPRRWDSSRKLDLHDLSRIHDVQRIERALDRTHQVHLDDRLVAHIFITFQLPDAVLGGDRA